MAFGIISCIIGTIALIIDLLFGVLLLITSANLSVLGLFIMSGLMIAAGITGIVAFSAWKIESLHASGILHGIASVFSLLQLIFHGFNILMVILLGFNIVALLVRINQYEQNKNR